MRVVENVTKIGKHNACPKKV